MNDNDETRHSLYLKELSGARWREYNRQQTPTFFYTKISLKEEIEFAVDKVNYKNKRSCS